MSNITKFLVELSLTSKEFIASLIITIIKSSLLYIVTTFVYFKVPIHS